MIQTITTLELLNRLNQLKSPAVMSICSSCSDVVIDDDDVDNEIYNVDGVDVVVQATPDDLVYYINPSDECYFCDLADPID